MQERWIHDGLNQYCWKSEMKFKQMWLTKIPMGNANRSDFKDFKNLKEL